MDYVKTLKDIAIELVEDKEHLEVRQMPSLDEKVVVLHVYSAKNDIAKLIGRKGVMANSIRQLMSVAGRLSDKKLDIKFDMNRCVKHIYFFWRLYGKIKNWKNCWNACT